MMKTSADSKHFSKVIRKSWKQYKKSYQNVQKSLTRKKVHDFRDSIQKLNAVLETVNSFIPSEATLSLVEDLKSERKILGPLRNAQVELHLLRDFQNQPFYQFLERRKTKVRKKALKGLKKVPIKLQQKCVARLKESLSQRSINEGDWLGFQNSIRSQEQDLQKELSHVSQLSERRIHELRILSKKLLYQGECLRDAFKKEVISLKKYREVHDVLGEIRNEVVILKVLEKYMKRKKNSKDELAVALSIDLAEDRSRKVEDARQKWSEGSWQH